MRWLQLFSVLLLVALAATVLLTPVLALDQLTGFVNDEAGVISEEGKQILNNELYNLKLNTSVEMAVATVTSLNGTPIEEYSLNLAHKTLGEKGKDNGILVLLAVDDREYRIEVGYGLEPVLNAALLGRIGRNIMEPSFKQGNYEQGILDGVKVIDAILMNDTSVETQGSGANISQTIVPPLIIMAIIFLIIILPIIISIAVSYKKAKKESKKKGKENDHDFLAALIIANMFGRGGSGGSGGSGGFGGGGFGGFGGGSFGGGGFSGKF